MEKTTNSMEKIFNVKIQKDHLLSSDRLTILFTIDGKFPSYAVHHSKTFLNHSKAKYIGMCHFLRNWEFTFCFNSWYWHDMVFHRDIIQQLSTTLFLQQSAVVGTWTSPNGLFTMFTMALTVDQDFITDMLHIQQPISWEEWQPLKLNFTISAEPSPPTSINLY